MSITQLHPKRRSIKAVKQVEIHSQVEIIHPSMVPMERIAGMQNEAPPVKREKKRALGERSN
jgi:hypothetical protein